MPIDTSSYYPEVPSGDGREDSFSLNDRENGLFGNKPSPSLSPEEKTEPVPPAPAVSVKHDGKDDDASGQERFATGLSHLLSWILVPLMMPVYGLVMAFGLSILDVAPMGMRVAFTLIVAGIDVAVPMLIIFALKKIGIVEDLGLNGRRERLIPYIIMIICYASTAFFMAFKGAPFWLTMFFTGGALAATVCMAINFRWKISAHSAGIAGIVALLIRIEKDGSPEPELFFWLVLTICLAGLLGSARVWLGRHSVWQVLAGYVVGFCCVFFLTMIN